MAQAERRANARRRRGREEEICVTDASWGDPDSKGFDRYIVAVEAGGIKVRCHKEVAPLVEHLLDTTAKRGYALAGGQPDDWGYCNRCIRGTGPGTKKPCKKSNHSWGLALDLNATKNPMTSDGKVHTNMPDWMVRLWKEWGFSWGGGYSHSRKDPMHYEFLGSKADAKRLVAALQRGPAKPADPAAPKPKPKPKPAPKRNPYKPQAAGTVLTIGAHGDHVRFVQWALRATEDGDFGPRTAEAVKRFQKAHQLKADGKVGDQTLHVLAKVTR